MAEGWTVEASAYFHGIKHQIPLSTGRDEGDQHFAKLSFTCVHFHACPSGAGRPPVGTSEGHELGCSAQLEGPAGPERRPTHTQHGPGPAGSGDARLGGRGGGGKDRLPPQIRPTELAAAQLWADRRRTKTRKPRVRTQPPPHGPAGAADARAPCSSQTQGGSSPEPGRRRLNSSESEASSELRAPKEKAAHICDRCLLMGGTRGAEGPPPRTPGWLPAQDTRQPSRQARAP